MGFQQGLSGLNSSSKQLDVIGNNVANASTVGFKQSQAQFADMYAASLSGGNTLDVGTGAKVVAVAQQFTQGNISSTNNPLDMAISGKGFFQVEGPGGEAIYSRNGQFQLDKNGFVVNNQGMKLVGYGAVDGKLNIDPGPIKINANDLAPRQTEKVALAANLDSRAKLPLNATFDPSNPDTYNSTIPVNMYDSLGVPHVASLYFQRQPSASTGALPTQGATLNGSTLTFDSSDQAYSSTLKVGDQVTLALQSDPNVQVVHTITAIGSDNGNPVFTVNPPGPVATGNAAHRTLVPVLPPSNDWNVYMSVDGGMVPQTITPMATLSFSPEGKLITATATSPATQGVSGEVVSDPSYTPLGANPMPIAFDFNKLTQYGSKFGINSTTQDGYTVGRLTGFSTAADGTIQGRYTNGQSNTLGQVMLANFTNPQGLQPVGDNGWLETVASGQVVRGVAGTGNFGTLDSLSVEESNVDLTNELVNMITAQRSYQANAQTIKTQDQLLQTIVNLR